METLTKKERIGGTCKDFMLKILEKKGLKTLLSTIGMPSDTQGLEDFYDCLHKQYIKILLEEKKQKKDWDRNYKKFLKEEENFLKKDYKK